MLAPHESGREQKTRRLPRFVFRAGTPSRLFRLAYTAYLEEQLERFIRLNAVRDIMIEAGRKRRNPDEVHRLPVPPVDVPLPLRDEVPEWSEGTLKIFATLTPLERSWAAHYASGSNAFEAYRRATGREYTDRATDTSRMNAHNIRVRPHVQVAVKAALKDLNFDPRMNRAWMLNRLEAALDKVEVSDEPAAQSNVVRIVRIIAELKGELIKKVEQTTDGGQQSDVRKRLDQLFEDAQAWPLRGSTAGNADPGPAGVADPPDPPVVPERRPPGAGVPFPGG